VAKNGKNMSKKLHDLEFFLGKYRSRRNEGHEEKAGKKLRVLRFFVVISEETLDRFANRHREAMR